MASTYSRDKIADALDAALNLSEDYLEKKHGARSQVNERMSDLDGCIHHFQQVVALAAQDDRRHLLALRGLGEAYLDRFNETRSTEDADKSIESHTKAIELTPDDDIGLLNTLKQCGKAYNDRYQQDYRVTDRDRGIHFWDLFVECASSALAGGNDPEDTGLFDTEWMHYSGLFGDLYHERYLDDGGMANLEKAIDLIHQSINPDAGGDCYQGVRKYHLGVAYGSKHQATGSMEHLKQCIDLYEEAQRLLPDNHQDAPGLMKCLGTAYRDRANKTSGLEDIDLAIQCAKAAINFPQGSSTNLSERHAILGSAYEDRYRRTRHPQDLKMSLQCKRKALDLLPKDDHQRAEQLSSLANGHATRFSMDKTIEDLNQSIQLNQEALELTPEGHLNRPYFSNNLGMNYHARFMYNNEQYMGQPAHSAHLIQRVDMTDLEKSIQLKEAALHKTPAEDPSRASWLFGLGEGYEERYYVTDDESDWDHALDLIEQALACDSSPAQDRLKAGLDLVDKYTVLSAGPSRWPEAHKAASKTMALMPLLASPSLGTNDKLLLLDRASSLGPDFAAIALECGESAFEALQHLEQGRGMVSKFKNGLRVDESRLRETHPDLADEFAKLRVQTEAPPTDTPQRGSTRHDAGRKLEALIMEMRRMPGFDSDVPVMSEDDLRAAAERGPIVSVNTSRLRCDAFIVDRSGVRVLPLPGLKYRDLVDNVRNQADPEVMELLWTSLAEPVLDELGFTKTPSDGSWPHVWWIPTDILTNFPIHAAGRYSHKSCHGVLDRAISSYSGTIHMLLHARSRPFAAAKTTKGEKVVLVAMDETPDLSPLTFASEEVARVESICQDAGFCVSKPLPTQRDVLTALDGCKIFHFAGHGQSHHRNPLQSMLLLSDWNADPLTVSILCETDLCNQTPFLAYLSACTTGHIDHGQDEGLHLIGACQLAGFRHVIGTLWQVQDDTAADIAVETYKRMLCHGLNDDSISEALHHAVRGLRNQWVKSRTPRGARGRKQRGSRAQRRPRAHQRDVVPESGSPELSGFWVPLVHFGV